MTADRIKEIQMATAYPDSMSVQQALLQVWNECEQEHQNKARDTAKVTRFEVIDVDEEGRVYTNYNCKVVLSYQDDGKTLKAFITSRNK
jgi:hypothetical protein